MIEALVNQETLRDILPLLFALPTLMAFSPPVRQEIFFRDSGTCHICGKKNSDGYRIDIAHFSHNKNDPKYDTPEMGFACCLQCHLESSPPEHKHLIQKRIDEKGLRWK